MTNVVIVPGAAIQADPCPMLPEPVAERRSQSDPPASRYDALHHSMTGGLPSLSPVEVYRGARMNTTHAHRSLCVVPGVILLLINDSLYGEFMYAFMY